ncbi:RDD family protein [Nocardia seriolae]|uniref:RDD family protein n=1 Tax=Nocardia seriolae TaxID=37332 RepID=UPI00051A0E90|nr:RDD family protein [Nocardia seriolae]MTJ60039.1 RDD family protein [Nocardia seriolae]MTJ70109.1 RDD family protein [Nocardia seriolae]MTJ85041.1 RDD family protein [Nocardia seriolae]MTK29036.1 RDD family protein [Nocardia seriolae]MTK37969.1 RDD family protein [Nocardia seriolae]
MALFTTGEAVAVELPVARIPTRAAAFLLDLLVQIVLGILLMLVLVALLVWADADAAWRDAATLVAVVSALIGYPVLFETFSRGRSVGKMAVGLRVVRADGGPIDFRHAVTRGLAGIVDFWILGTGLIAIVVSMCSPNARRVGDALAGTVVVHDRTRLPYAALAAPPPWLAGWARRLDLSGLPDDRVLSMRKYLLRFRTLTPQVQDQLGRALVIAACASLGTPPLNGYPPLQILGAVLAERQRREIPPPPALGVSPFSRHPAAQPATARRSA